MKNAPPQRLAYLLMALCLAGLVAAAWQNERAPKPVQFAYLHPINGPQDIWLASLDDPDSPQQLTHSPFGIASFDVSRDGAQIVYSQRDETGFANLHLLDLPRRKTRMLLDCAALEVECANPRFNPAADKIAYERGSRIWLAELDKPTATAPLIADEHVKGHSPTWAADGRVVGFSAIDHEEYGIMLYDFTDEDRPLRFIHSAHGTMGALSADARLLLFAEVAQRGEQVYSRLRLADMAQKHIRDFSDPDAPVHDVSARFSPDSQTVAIARQYTDSRWTPGAQLYLVSLGDEEDWRAVAHDPRYTTAYARWDGAGERLLLQRLPLDAETGIAKPEVWLYDIEADRAAMLVQDAFLPQWVGS